MTLFSISGKTSFRLSAIAVASVLALSACSKGEQQQQQGAPELVVSVLTVKAEDTTISTELPGRLESFRSAEVRPQVSGIIKRRLFQEGSYVQAGQALYQLDDASYSAGLASARAQLAAAEAAQAKANADLARYQPLVAADAISKQEYDAAVAAQRSAVANVNAARAAIRSAQVNVNHARITAPISGYIGRSNVSEGALLTAGGATVLATIQQTNPMYVNVTQSALDVMKLRRQIAEGQMSAVNGAVEVTIILEDGSEYPQKGRLLFTDPTVNETTGQVSLRVEVPNDDNILLPGLYVRVRLPQAQANRAYLIPQRAVTRGAKDTVVIVAPDGSMRPQEVTIAGQSGNNWIITSGLKDGDKVAMDGTMIAGMMGAQKVKTQEWQASQPQQSAAPAAPAKPNSASAPAQPSAAASAPAAQSASQAK
ncbi:efflux RND transporter periplasmic adaptor subunit [Eikenella corrodens]|uniref:Efflux transporter, RND family, MFP subunit n=2 Tax=Eikenella corrodens TaxID=539 RepID=C0DXJ0_EIKCO|nr:efflux RND transporter periplasmic adaptor subunit [Eikenella corrodens]EEG23171.1 efflux transporter, RND family, MFP subunit [Eikenella corrodens ATCC 23834]OAM20139.1 efflux transporter periplasmic adaptor subunit [Eikenella corrodens]OWP27991.1 efflux transporter periplasmic adaptor subunit [Eikenella corrodens]UAK74554.1 efflux RND transporter periplasmic adaptor subunit [Eikenella corrodens]SNW09592.1 Acriflavine resistance protein A precursor [Eikenella corrodens]